MNFTSVMKCPLCKKIPPNSPVILDCTHVLCESCALQILANSSAVWRVSKDSFKIGECPQCKTLFIEPAMLHMSGRKQLRSPDLDLWRELFTPIKNNH